MTLVTLAVAACGADRTGGPRGRPVDVVRAAPDRTFAAGSARVEATSPDAQSRGRVAFDDPASTPLAVKGRGGAAAYPEMAEPLVLVDLMRGAVGVVSYGGVAVRGVSTFHYELNVNLARALPATPASRRDRVTALARQMGGDGFYADVWVDDAGRLRRVQVPVDKASRRQSDRNKILARLISVDFFDYRPGG
ncbi:MAG: hypothetical protein ACRDZW_11740 [Acidimicrobiales bacterium]